MRKWAHGRSKGLKSYGSNTVGLKPFYCKAAHGNQNGGTMITFTDENLYVKGTCNAICYDITTNDIVYQSSKMTTGSIAPSVKLNEIRSGLGNPVAEAIATDPSLQVDFEAADFQMWAKSAQLGLTPSYGATAQVCQTVTATGNTLTIDIAEGIPTSPVGGSQAFCFIQKVGAESKLLNDGKAYTVGEDGTISNFNAVAGTQYKVTYYKEIVGARKVAISSFIQPKVVRFECQIAVYSNKGSLSSGTRVGWLYYTIPYLKLQGDATITGDQNNNDTTKISGQALSYDTGESYDAASERKFPTLALLVYVPDDATAGIKGITVFGGTINAVAGEPTQIPIYFIMEDGSIMTPPSYAGFNYTIPEEYMDEITVTEFGEITAMNAANVPILIDYYGKYEFELMLMVSPSTNNDNRVGYGAVGYMVVA